MKTAFEPKTGYHRVCFGSDPRVVVTADAPYVTDDPELTARLADHPRLQPVDTKAKRAGEEPSS